MGILSGLLGNAGVVSAEKLAADYGKLLTDGETIEVGFVVIRDTFVFTNKRLILVNIQGITGSKTEYFSIPYSKITKYSIETAGTFDLDAELKIWVSGSPDPIQKTLKKGSDVRGVQRAIATAIFR